MEYDKAYLKFRNELVVWSNYSETIVHWWQSEEHKQKGRQPNQRLQRLRSWAKQWEHSNA